MVNAWVWNTYLCYLIKVCILGRPRYRWKFKILMDIKDAVVFSGVDWIHLAQDSFHSGFQQRWIIVNTPSDY
jgi:hypothetical protein